MRSTNSLVDDEWVNGQVNCGAGHQPDITISSEEIYRANYNTDDLGLVKNGGGVYIRDS